MFIAQNIVQLLHLIAQFCEQYENVSVCRCISASRTLLLLVTACIKAAIPGPAGVLSVWPAAVGQIQHIQCSLFPASEHLIQEHVKISYANGINLLYELNK